jgi:hypothetical protein
LQQQPGPLAPVRRLAISVEGLQAGDALLADEASAVSSLDALPGSAAGSPGKDATPKTVGAGGGRNSPAAAKAEVGGSKDQQQTTMQRRRGTGALSSPPAYYLQRLQDGGGDDSP